MSLCIYPHTKNKSKTLSRRHSVETYPKPHKETSLTSFHRGSLTVEAAVVLPVIACCLVTVIYFFRILLVQEAIDQALYYAGQKVSVESSITDSEAALLLSAEYFFLQILDEYDFVDTYVENGRFGVSLIASTFTEEDILLRAQYRMKLPVPFLNKERLYFWQQNRFRKWVGDTPKKTETDVVYITATGEVYHATTTCRVLSLSIHSVSRDKVHTVRGENGQKYTACTRCGFYENGVNMVYYTDYGSLYHYSTACSALKRTIITLSISEIGERRPCSYCY